MESLFNWGWAGGAGDSSFQAKYTTEQRVNRKNKLLLNYSGEQKTKLACVVLEMPTSASKQGKPYRLFVVPSSAKVFDFLSEVKKMLKIKETQSVYLIAGDMVLNPTSRIEDVYDRLHEEDGFLYVKLREVNFF
jgi:hypothetical protein